MRIGDIEYTRVIQFGAQGTVNESELIDVSFALGIKIRPLLVRTLVAAADVVGATTGGYGCFFENSREIPSDSTLNALVADERAHPLFTVRQVLNTNGMTQLVPQERTWWKILLPNIRLHSVATAQTAVVNVSVTLAYRFAELTDDEIVEIAAQRAQN